MSDPVASPDILVVDNDPLVRLGTVVMLRDIGYQGASTAEPAEVLARVKDGNAPAILVTDYSMPEMTGAQLARGVQAERPDTRVLIMTGHDRLNDKMEDGWSVLAKPFTSGELRDAINALIGGSD